VQVIQIENYTSHHQPSIRCLATGGTRTTRTPTVYPECSAVSPPAAMSFADVNLTTTRRTSCRQTNGGEIQPQ